jgi:hypothetical protein
LAACGASPKLPEDLEAWVLDLEECKIQDLVEQYPNLDSELDRAVGYAIFGNEATKVPVVGKGERRRRPAQKRKLNPAIGP